MTEDAQVVAIHPENDGYTFCLDKSKAAYTGAKSFMVALMAAGVKIPAKYHAAWDMELQAWVGQLVS